MRNRKNIVLMFLIIMLSFAIVSEVSATSTDDAEIGESSLNAEIVSIYSTETGISGERFHEVSDVFVVDAINHSDNNQTSLRDAPYGVYANKNLYEQEPTDYIYPGEKMENLSDLNLNNTLNLILDNEITSIFSANSISDVTNNVLSKLIGLDNISVVFKNSKKDQFILSDFNGILPKMIKMNNPFIPDDFVGKTGNLSKFDRDLSFNSSFLPETNISLTKNELPKSYNTIPGFDNNQIKFP